MNILITGASGFLGSHLVNELSVNHNVIGIGRRVVKFSEKVTYYQCDLVGNNLEMIDKESIDVIFHVAAKADFDGDFNTFKAINTDVTKQLVNKFPLSKFVYISTPSIYAKGANRKQITEEDEINSTYVQQSNYAYTKYLGEKYVIKNHKNHIIIRPRAILGVGDTTLWPTIIQASFFPLFQNGNVLLSYTYITDLIDFCEKICQSSVTNEIFNVSSGSIKTKDALCTVRLFQKKKSIRIPFKFMKVILSVVPTKHVKIEQLELLAYDMDFDVSKAQKHGLHATKTFEEIICTIFSHGTVTKGEWKWKK